MLFMLIKETKTIDYYDVMRRRKMTEAICSSLHWTVQFPTIPSCMLVFPLCRPHSVIYQITRKAWEGRVKKRLLAYTPKTCMQRNLLLIVYFAPVITQFYTYFSTHVIHFK